MKAILTIAGYDPSSGAGITKDLDIFFSHGFHGFSIPTCMVVQGPHGVRDIYPLPRDQFVSMVKVIEKDVPVDGVKIGMVWDAMYVEIITKFLHKMGRKPIVVDPICMAKNGKQLVTERGLRGLIKKIFPLATVITPNLEEASLITGRSLKTLDDVRDCVKSLKSLGSQGVVVKGGHLQGEPVDVLYDEQGITLWRRHRVEREVHGTGCAFSSIFTTFLVGGYPIRDAFFATEKEMDHALKESYQIAHHGGYYYTSSSILRARDSERWDVLNALFEVKEKLNQLNPVELIPEVQMNVGYAIPHAKGIEDVAAFPGRISQCNGKIFFKGEPKFGVSSHVARLILGIMKYYPHMRACVNVRYDEAYIKNAEKGGLCVVFFDRKKEPGTIKISEGRSLDFLMDSVLKKVTQPPDLIYDRGDVGKEPIIRCFAQDPMELIKKMEMIRS